MRTPILISALSLLSLLIPSIARADITYIDFTRKDAQGRPNGPTFELLHYEPERDEGASPVESDVLNAVSEFGKRSPYGKIAAEELRKTRYLGVHSDADVASVRDGMSRVGIPFVEGKNLLRLSAYELGQFRSLSAGSAGREPAEVQGTSLDRYEDDGQPVSREEIAAFVANELSADERGHLALRRESFWSKQPKTLARNRSYTFVRFTTAFSGGIIAAGYGVSSITALVSTGSLPDGSAILPIAATAAIAAIVSSAITKFGDPINEIARYSVARMHFRNLIRMVGNFPSIVRGKSGPFRLELPKTEPGTMNRVQSHPFTRLSKQAVFEAGISSGIWGLSYAVTRLLFPEEMVLSETGELVMPLAFQLAAFARISVKLPALTFLTQIQADDAINDGVLNESQLYQVAYMGAVEKVKSFERGSGGSATEAKRWAKLARVAQKFAYRTYDIWNLALIAHSFGWILSASIHADWWYYPLTSVGVYSVLLRQAYRPSQTLNPMTATPLNVVKNLPYDIAEFASKTRKLFCNRFMNKTKAQP